MTLVEFLLTRVQWPLGRHGAYESAAFSPGAAGVACICHFARGKSRDGDSMESPVERTQILRYFLIFFGMKLYPNFQKSEPRCIGCFLTRSKL